MAITQAYVLVVDDDSVNRLLLSRSLEREGHRCATAENGRQALEILRAEAFDAVLLDVVMPEIDGFEVLAQMQADGELRHIPVIMISALEDIESVVRCIELGAEDYLPKPFNPVLLRARINGYLTRSGLTIWSASESAKYSPASCPSTSSTRSSGEPMTTSGSAASRSTGP